MGNQQTNFTSRHKTNNENNEQHSQPQQTAAIKKNSLKGSTSSSSSSSTAGLNENNEKFLLPIEKLAKILIQKTQQEEGFSAIGLNTFKKYLFPQYPLFGEKLYNFLHQGKNQSGAKQQRLTAQQFKQQCDKLLAVLDDETILLNLVKMFGDESTITPSGMQEMLMAAYQISMDHYSEGPQMCLLINKTINSVISSCFHTKLELSVQFVSHWLGINCPRLIFPLHRYAVHSLATSYRSLETHGPTLLAGLELATPVLEQPLNMKQPHPHPHLLQMSMSWLLAGALPQVYSRPQKANSPTNYLTKFLCSLPSHWINLYDSSEMGLGTNRFLHHVLAYKGPTLTLLKVQNEDQIFCVASPCEWKESHLYWGDEESCLFQLLPKFLLLEKGMKMLYLNTHVRGYPLGLRAGKDPRNPIIAVDGGFEKIEFKKIPYILDIVEVWGCGDQASREVQLDIKKWQVKEAERQRCVKLSADDWLDHPDRYLLELAGRPQYHQKQT